MRGTYRIRDASGTIWGDLRAENPLAGSSADWYQARVRLPLIVLVLGACATGGRTESSPDSGSTPDPTPDSAVQPTPDTPGQTEPDSGQQQPATALMITEVALAPTGGEFIEIANLTSQTVDLSTYYLSDSGNYFRLPAGAIVDSSDFIIRFNAGSTIAPGTAITVAIDTAASFQTTYGVAPTFALGSGGMQTVASSGIPTLTNAGELVVLFRWDGTADLVADSDLLLVGIPTAANGLVDKSAQAIDGPDADSTPTSYGSDTRTIVPQSAAPNAGQSTKRIALDTGFEVTGVNGISGDDETSENTSMTWDTTFTAPTPDSLPTALLQ